MRELEDFPRETRSNRQVDTPPSRRLRVLFVAKRFPYPTDTGGKIRTARLLERLQPLLDITLVSNVEHPRDDPYLAHARTASSEFHAVPWIEIPKSSPRFYLRVLRQLFAAYPVTVLSDYCPQLAQRIAALVHERPFDLIVCDFLQPSLNLFGITHCPSLLFQHNVESVIWKRHADTSRNPLLRRFWLQQWRKMERYERQACGWFTGVVAVSSIDARLLRDAFGARRVFTIPTAVDTDYFRPAAVPVENASLVFTGSMDWLANEDGVLFLVEHILPRIRVRVPDITLTVVGRHPSRRLLRRLRRHPEVHVTGRVDDIRPFVRRCAVYVVPLRIGGGTRLKIYEAMAMEKVVVSTPIGAEGLPIVDGQHLLLAKDPDAFADAVVNLLRDPAKRAHLGRAAREFVETHSSWDRAAAAFYDACHATVKG